MLNDEKKGERTVRGIVTHNPQSSDFVLVRGSALCLLIDSDEDIRSSIHVTRK